jgi:CubicO group peptidase (beta-lactamase class C family)
MVEGGPSMSAKTSATAATALLLVLFNLTAFGQSAHRQNTEKAGFDAERLEKLHAMVQRHIDDNKHAGAVTLLARNGKIADIATFGYRDLEARTPMTQDTIFRIYSMSKIITSAAALMLFEEGRFTLDDSVADYIPELRSLKVMSPGGGDGDLSRLKRPITIRHLLTHTAGFTYDFSAPEQLKQHWAKTDIWNENVDFKEFIRRISFVPLAHQPGEKYTYGVNTDVLGYFVQVISGMPFEQFLQERMFGPLKMVDTGFDVPPEKMNRLAKLYENGPDKALRPVAKPPYGTYAEAGKGFPSGGGGLFSTANDYFRFGQMLLNGGTLDGKRVLGRKTIEFMTVNQLTFLEKPTLDVRGADGFGLGGSVRLDLAKSGTLGSVGQFGWSGAATTTFIMDPQEHMIALFFAQHLPFNQHGIFGKFSTLVYASLAD